MSLLKHSLFIWFQQPFVNRLCSLFGCLIDATLQLLSLDVDANVFESVWTFAFRQQVTGRDSLKDRPPRPVKIAESDIDVSSVLSLLKPTFWALLTPLTLSVCFAQKAVSQAWICASKHRHRSEAVVHAVGRSKRSLCVKKKLKLLTRAFYIQCSI